MNQKNKMPTAHGGGRKFRNDVIFIAGLLVVVILIGAAFFLLCAFLFFIFCSVPQRKRVFLK